MTKLEYIYTRTFGLLFYCNYWELGIELKDIPRFWTDIKGKSRVISARTNARRSYNEKNFRSGTIKINKTLVSENSSIYAGEVGHIELFLWMGSATLSKIKDLFRENKDQIENIRAIYGYYSAYNGKNTESAIFLLDLTEDESNITDEEIKYARCLNLKKGGVEIIHEYLTSTFIQEHDILISEFSRDERKSEFSRSDGTWSSKISPFFTFSSNSDFTHLTKNKIEYDFDDESGVVYIDQNDTYPYFNLSLDIIERLNKNLTMPERIRELLTAEQLKKLPDICREIVIDNIVLIFESCFKQLHFFPEMPAKLYRPYDTWGSDMYGALGGDGGDSVYLGDGMSINPDGSIDDD
jgi:hypothetical protein